MVTTAHINITTAIKIHIVNYLYNLNKLKLKAIAEANQTYETIEAP